MMEVLVLKEMFLGERVDFLASDDFAGAWVQSWRLESLVEDKVKYAAGGMGTGNTFFPNTAKPGEVGRLLLWAKTSVGTGEETSLRDRRNGRSRISFGENGNFQFFSPKLHL